jgi:hypothetical protein
MSQRFTSERGWLVMAHPYRFSLSTYRASLWFRIFARTGAKGCLAARDSFEGRHTRDQPSKTFTARHVRADTSTIAPSCVQSLLRSRRLPLWILVPNH